MQTQEVFDFGLKNRELSQKFRMAAFLLNSPVKARIESSGSEVARDLLRKAEASFSFARGQAKNQKWLEANAIIESVLRDLTASSKLLNKISVEQNKFEETLKRVEAFTYPYWQDLSKSDQKLLEQTNTQIEELMKKASTEAAQEKYEEGSNLLLMAYSLKSQLLQRLEHDNTVVYDLIFDTPEEEYSYLIKRKEHFNELLEGVLEKNIFPVHTLNLVNVYIKKSEDKVVEASSRKESGEHKQASQLLEQSIQDLSTALKILGVKI
jgi:cellobiose-specific phosphotransferase system component IIA